ncbi:MAG TPA: HDOD domain-containing protein [Bryobacteraceae bacterium]|nr:HDOD domain-containing protein [Bryobacteraceae bacterium]
MLSTAPDREKALRALDRLPPLSANTGRLLSYLVRRDVEVGAVAGILERDALLGPRVLQLANSGAFGPRSPIQSIRHAVAFVGARVIRRQVISWSIISIFRRFHAFPGWSFTRFSMHAEATALLTDLLCENMPVAGADTGYIAALVHDVGKLLLYPENPQVFEAIFDCCRLTRETAVVCEKMILGVDHAELSAAAAERWKLPHSAAHAVLLHHLPEPDDQRVPLSLVLSKADGFINAIGLGLLEDSGNDDPKLEWPGREHQVAQALKSFEGAWRAITGIRDITPGD